MILNFKFLTFLDMPAFVSEAMAGCFCCVSSVCTYFLLLFSGLFCKRDLDLNEATWGLYYEAGST